MKIAFNDKYYYMKVDFSFEAKAIMHFTLTHTCHTVELNSLSRVSASREWTTVTSWLTFDHKQMVQNAAAGLVLNQPKTHTLYLS